MLLVADPGGASAAEPRPLPGEAPLPPELKQRIDDGEAAFRVQNYAAVVQVLDRLAGHPLLEGRPENLRVLEMLGASHWFMNAKDSARLIFGQLLRESPFLHLDDFFYPRELIDFFETRRRELVTAGVIPATPTENSGPRRVLVRELKYDTTPAVVFIAPFGIGQFVNGDSGKGTALAIAQGLGVAAMIGATIGIETLKEDNSDEIIIEDHGDQADLLNVLWYGGAILTAATWTYSIIDGFANRRTEPVIEERYELLDQAKPETSLRLLPGPGDLGVGLGVTF